MERPTSITVVAWILIATSVLNLVTSTVNMNDPMVRELMAKSPLPIPVQFAMIYVGLTVNLACGMAMLDGRNWGRWLYVIWGLFGMAVGLATSPIRLLMIPGLLVFYVFAMFLFGSKAKLYFTCCDAPGEQNT